jgi:hypothetical protein
LALALAAVPRILILVIPQRGFIASNLFFFGELEFSDLDSVRLPKKDSLRMKSALRNDKKGVILKNYCKTRQAA